MIIPRELVSCMHALVSHTGQEGDDHPALNLHAWSLSLEKFVASYKRESSVKYQQTVK